MSMIERLLDQMREVIKAPELDRERLVEILIALVRRRVRMEDVAVHIERLRAVNEVLEDDPQVDYNATDALDLLGRPERWLPRCDGQCVTAEDLGFSGFGDGVNPGMVAYAYPGCPAHDPDGVAPTDSQDKLGT